MNHLNMSSSYSVRHDGEFNELTERLHLYIKKMREMRNGAPELDSHNFFKSIDAMEMEMKNVRSMYESEVHRLRQHLEEVSSQRSQLQLQNSKLEATASSLQSRMVAECEKTKSVTADLTTLQTSFYQKEQELQRTVQQSMTAKTAQQDVKETSRQLDQTLRENLDLHHRYEAELLQRRENEEKVHQLQEQISFSEKVARQQKQDLQDRLAAANTAIINLEGKMHVLDKPGHEEKIGEMIAGIRDAAEKELHMYKQEAEDMFNKNVDMLKAQIEADRKTIDAVTEENRRLLGVVEELSTKIRSLEDEIIHIGHLKRSADENVVSETERFTRHIHTMEGKLKDLQDMLFEKTKELNATKIQNLPLKAEIEGLRALIDEEEKRLAMDTKLPPLHSPDTRSPDGNSPKRAGNVSLGDVRASMSVYSTTDPTPGGTGSFYLPEKPYEPFPTATVTNKHIGPIRAKSSESKGEPHMAVVETTFTDVQTSAPITKPSTVTAHDYNQCTNSATGDIRVQEVSADGNSIVLVNTSADQTLDVGSFTLKQQVGGHPVAVYRFPSNTSFAPKSYITVFSGCNDPILHQPPTQFVWKEQERWGTGPECTTLFCKPNGQAVAWTTAAHRFGAVQMNSGGVVYDSSDDIQLPVYAKNPNSCSSDTLFLKRGKENPPSLAPQRHPHGNAQSLIHPQFNERRVKDLGNDNSSNHRQTRSQTHVPDKVSGEPYAGMSGKMMGSSTMRRYTTTNGNVRKNGSITNRMMMSSDLRMYNGGRTVCNICHQSLEPGWTSDGPNPFMTPKNRHMHGIQQIQSQHHQSYNPPMPRPPCFSSW